MNLNLKELEAHVSLDIASIKTVIEIGCLHGGDAVEYARYFHNARVYIFEANPLQAYKITQRIKHRPQIEFIDKAVSDHDGEITFYPVDPKATKNIGLSSVYPFDASKEQGFRQKNPRGRFVSLPSIKVPCVSINNWAAEQGIERIDVAEIDVQGHELYVLQGMTDYLPNMRVIIIEENLKPYYVGQPPFAVVNDLLVEHGFKKVAGFNSNEWDQTSIYVNQEVK